MLVNRDAAAGDSLVVGAGVCSLTTQNVFLPEEWVGQVGDPVDLARKLGYQYILWNEHVYQVEQETVRDTGLTELDIH